MGFPIHIILGSNNRRGANGYYWEPLDSLMIVSGYFETLTLALICIVLDSQFSPLVASYTFKGKLLLNKKKTFSP